MLTINPKKLESSLMEAESGEAAGDETMLREPLFTFSFEVSPGALYLLKHVIPLTNKHGDIDLNAIDMDAFSVEDFETVDMIYDEYRHMSFRKTELNLLYLSFLCCEPCQSHMDDFF